MTYQQLVRAFAQACAYGRGASHGTFSPAEHAFWYLTGYLGIPTDITQPVSHIPPLGDYDPNQLAEERASERRSVGERYGKSPEDPINTVHGQVEAQRRALRWNPIALEAFDREMDARIQRELERQRDSREGQPDDDR